MKTLPKKSTYKFLLTFLILLNTCCVNAQPLEKSVQKEQHITESLDSIVTSQIKKEFGRQDLDVFVVLTPKNVLENINSHTADSVRVHSFNIRKQKCRVTVKTPDSQNLSLEAQYSFSKVVPVLNRNLKSGSLILASDLKWQRCEMPFTHFNEKDLLENKESMVGRQLTKSIKAGKPIYDSFFTNYIQNSRAHPSVSGGTSLSGSFFGSAFGMAGKVIGSTLALMMIGFVINSLH